MTNRSKIGSKVDEKKHPQKHRFWERFWVDFGAKLGAKIDKKSIQEGIEKAMQKRMAHGSTKQSKRRLGQPGAALIQTPGEGVGGGVNPSPEGLRAVIGC